MTIAATIVKITLLDTPLRIKSPPDEAKNLLAAAKILDATMRTIAPTQDPSYARTLTLAAIEISRELFLLRQQHAKLAEMSSKLDKLLI